MTTMRPLFVLSLVLLSLSAPGCSSEPAPPMPTGVVLVISPARAAYRRGENILVTANVVDQYGEVNPDLTATLTVTPETAVSGAMMLPAGTRYTLAETGRITFEGCADELSPGGTEYCDEAVILVDDGSPVLEVSSPRPGEEIGGVDAMGAPVTEIVVRGSVSDMRMSRVFVNGMLAEVDALGMFEASVPPTFGVNHLTVVASDGVLEASTVEMDVLWAPAYARARTSWGAPGVSLPEGITLDLGEDFFDDGAPLASRERPVVTEDLADLAALVIGEIDAASLLSHPVVDSAPTFVLDVTDVRLEGLAVEITPDDDALDLFLRISSLEADTTGQIDVEGTRLSLNGGLVAGVAGYVRVRVRRTSVTAPIEVELESLDVALERIEGRFSDPRVNAVLALATGLLRTTLENELRDVLRDLLGAAVPDLLRSIFVGLDTALNGQTVSLDTGIFPRIDLLIDGQVASLTSRYGEGVRAVLTLDIGLDDTMGAGTSMHPESRGIALAANDVGEPFFRSARLQLGLRLALLNGLLHALWDGGMLEVDATSLLPESVSSIVSEAVLSGGMTPIIRAARAGEEHDLILSIGQLELDAVYTGDPVHYGMTLEAGIDIDVADNRLNLTIADEPFIRVWAMDDESARALTPDTLRSLLLTMLWPSLRESLADGLALELPIPAPDALTDLSPSLAGLSLSLSMTDRLTLRDETVVVEGVLRGTLP